jgi:hypothetical protein
MTKGMDRETLSEFFEGRTWGLCALILIGLNFVWLVVSVQVLGAINISLNHAALPRWLVRYMWVIVFSLVIALAMGVVGLIVDKRKAYAGLAMAAFVFSLALYGCAFE